MDRKSGDLADRLKAAIADREAERANTEAERARRLEQGALARQGLFEELEAFAKAVGHITARRDDEGVLMRHGERAVQFEASGEGDRVRVTIDTGGEPGWTGTSEHRIFREADLADRWVLSYRKLGREEKVPLFDRGLEELAVRGLGLPEPEPAPERPMSARLADALLGRDREPALRVVDGTPRGEPEPERREEKKPKDEGGPRKRRL